VANTVGSIRVTNPGSGYTRQPSVYLTGGGGQMASAAALLTGAIVMTDKMITEGFDAEYGRITTMLGSIPNPLTPNVGNGFVVGMARYVDPPTEIVNDGEATLWRIGHLGVDSHALHFHLFDVQVVNRVDWTNVVKPPYPDELGWRDTIRTNPQEDIIVAFRPHQAVLPFQLPRSNRLLDPTTPVNSVTNFYPVPPPVGIAAVPQLSNVMTDFGFEYVWHCHMLEHEENDFMRPLVLNVPIPPSPSPLTAAVSFPDAATVNVALTWGGATDFSVAQGFTIQRARDTAFTVGLKTFTVSDNTIKNYTDPLIRPVAATFYYRVRAFGVGGNSPWSNVVTVSTVPPVPPLPSPLTVTAVSFPTPTTASVALTWGGTTDFSVANGFTIQRATNTGFTVGLTTFTVSDNTIKTYTDATAEQNSLYYYRVRAFGVGGNSPWSNVVTVNTVQAPTAFAATVVSTPAVDSEKVHLTWTADGPPGSSFTIQRATNTTFTSGLVTSTVTPGTATLFNQLLVPNRATPYYYRIRKNATATLFSPWTAFITVPSVP
jgi:Tfp pilus assembly protein PilX